jgi:4-amino-4-deoxy-L-arabinose transferase-like glycosyltransferase
MTQITNLSPQDISAQASRVISFHAVIVLLLIFTSFFLSALVSERVFERLPHLEDEMAYLWQAKALAHGQTVLTLPQPVRPFWQPFVVDRFGKRFGKYSLGWPGILAIGVLLGQTWVVNAFLGALTVALTYRLGREIFGADTGLIAAALVAFSPMALLLNGTLMGHTSALFTATLFFYAYWRMERGKYALRWGLIAGCALGLTLINRPLAGVAVGAPLIAWSGVRLIRTLIKKGGMAELRRLLSPLMGLGGITLLLLLVIPAYNYAAIGDPSQNLYLLVWSYDRVGFGPGYGAHGHTLEKGIRQTRWDLSLTAADIFGWETGTISPQDQVHLLNAGDYWPHIGLSWILLPFGLLIGFKRRWLWWVLWLAAGTAILIYTTNNVLPAQLQNPTFSYLWMAGGALWILIPFTFLLRGKSDDQINWTWLLLAISVSLVGLHIAYWIGSQRYSTRYYYEALSAFALLSAIPLGWLAKRWRWPVYGALLALLLFSLYSYSMPRINALYRFNWVSPELIQAVEARREGNRPVLVLITGADVKWRAYGSLMASTNPFLDSDIVAAWNYGQSDVRDSILKLFPDRQVIEMTASGNRACFGDTMQGQCYGEALKQG